MPACSAMMVANSSASLIWFMVSVAVMASAVLDPYINCSRMPLPYSCSSSGSERAPARKPVAMRVGQHLNLS